MNESAPQTIQRYFDAWNDHDSAAIVATFAENGTYTDPTTPGSLSGPAIGAYAEALWAAFPDLCFEVASETHDDAGLVSAEWLMKGTNRGSLNGLPPTGAKIALPGADFIHFEGEHLRSVQGYFDSAALHRALGLDVIVQPKTIGPIAFGTSIRASSGNTATPAAFSVTWIEARSDDEKQKIEESGRRIVTEMLAMPGFISWVGATVGSRMMTVTAWETPEAIAQLMKDGEHRAAMTQFFNGQIGNSGFTSIWIPGRVNPRRLRCPECSKMLDADKAEGRCGCGAALPGMSPCW